MCLQGFAKRSSRNSNGRNAYLVGVENRPRQLSVWIWGRFPMIPPRSSKKRIKIPGDGAKEWREEKTVFWAVATTF